MTKEYILVDDKGNETAIKDTELRKTTTLAKHNGKAIYEKVDVYESNWGWHKAKNGCWYPKDEDNA